MALVSNGALGAELIGAGAGIPVWRDPGWFDVRTYGALGNGTTDDGAALQAALTAAGVTGGTVFLSPGIYKTGRALGIPSSVTVCGAGMGATVLRPTAGSLTSYNAAGQAWGAPLVAAGVTDVQIRDLTIDLQTNGCAANGIELGYDGTGVETNYAIVTRVRILGYVAQHSYQIWSRRARHVRIEDNWIDGHDPTPRSDATTIDHAGIEVFGGTDVVIARNTVLNCDGPGIDIYTTALLSTSDSIVIADNVVTGCWVGMQIGASVVSAVQQNVTNVNVAGNILRTNSYAGIHVINPSGALIENLTISHNTVTDSPYPFHLSGVSGSLWSALTITGNTVERATTTTGGLVDMVYVTGFLIAGNTFNTSAFNGIAASNCSDGVIQGNVIDGAVNIGIYSTFSQRLDITNNYISRWDVATATQSGIGGDGDNCTIMGNRFYRAAGQPRGVNWTAGDRTNVVRNRLLYAATSGVPFSNASTNPSVGSFTFVNLETNHTVTHSQATNNSYITVVQNNGTARALQKVVTGSGSFTVYLTAAADGTEVFKYEITQ